MTQPVRNNKPSRLVMPLFGLLCLSAASLVTQADERMVRGEVMYQQHCAACHQPDGKGIPGFFPPLAGNARVTSNDPAMIQRYLDTIIFGYHGGLIVNRQLYSGQMPPIGRFGRVNDDELLDLINYQRQAWGNGARPITARELAEARDRNR